MFHHLMDQGVQYLCLVQVDLAVLLDLLDLLDHDLLVVLEVLAILWDLQVLGHHRNHVVRLSQEVRMRHDRLWVLDAHRVQVDLDLLSLLVIHHGLLKKELEEEHLLLCC